MSQAISINADNFVSEVLEYPGVVLVDFWGPGCGPCRMLAPIVDQIAAENEGKVKVAKVDVYECSDVANHYGISSIPTLLIFKNGNVTEQFFGIQSKARIQSALDETLNA